LMDLTQRSRLVLAGFLPQHCPTCKTRISYCLSVETL
jgi:hypothetical protein